MRPRRSCARLLAFALWLSRLARLGPAQGPVVVPGQTGVVWRQPPGWADAQLGSWPSAPPAASVSVGGAGLRGALDLRARSLPSSGPSHGRDVVVLAGGRGADFVLWVSSSERGEDAIVLGTGQGLRNAFDGPAQKPEGWSRAAAAGASAVSRRAVSQTFQTCSDEVACAVHSARVRTPALACSACSAAGLHGDPPHQVRGVRRLRRGGGAGRP